MTQSIDNSRKSVFGLFPTQSELENALMQLKDRGFSRDDISVVMPKTDYGQQMGYEKDSKAPEGATIGATSGLVLGGTFGWLVGAGLLALTGFGPLIAAGPIFAALAGASVAGTIGGIGGALIGMGIPEYEAKRYESAVKDGSLLLSVHINNAVLEDRAKEILKNAGARDISSTKEKSGKTDQMPTPPPLMRDNFTNSTTRL